MSTTAHDAVGQTRISRVRQKNKGNVCKQRYREYYGKKKKVRSRKLTLFLLLLREKQRVVGFERGKYEKLQGREKKKVK